MMATFSNILCPIDSSEFAARTLRYAGALARRPGAALTVLTVRPPVSALIAWGPPNVIIPPDLPDWRPDTEAALERFVQETLGRQPARVLVVEGAVVPEILRVASEWPAHVIVMATHGASGVDRLLLGSITEKVLRRTEVPVLAIPPQAPDVPPERVARLLCAIDRSAAAASAIEYAAALAREHGARIVPVHVVEHLVDEDEQFAAHFDVDACYRELTPSLTAWYTERLPEDVRSWCDPVELRFGKARHHLLAVANERACDLIVTGTAAQPAMFGSTAHHVVRHANVPVLLVPAGTKAAREPASSTS